jgi:hypothetical protein
MKAIALALALGITACGADETIARGTPPGGGASDAAADTAGPSIGTPDARPGGEGGIDKCAGAVTKAKTDPLDLFIMLDQSGSMDMKINLSSDNTKWQEVTQAIAKFVAQPNLENLGVGLQYFALPSKGDGGDSCDPADYASADVPIAPLPGNAKAIGDSLAAHMPTTGTPTGPALQGALTFASNWAKANPDRIVVTVLATDGVPAGCSGDDIQHVAAVARNGFTATPSIRTFAIGIGTSFDDVLLDGGHWLDNLDTVAAAGGTTKAFPITNKVAQLFLDALNTIRGTALGCAFKLPEPMGRPLDFGQVNFLYTKGGTTAPVYVPKVANAAACSGDGWYYDDEKMPTRIIACDAMCKKLGTDYTGKVEIEVGCPTIVK